MPPFYTSNILSLASKICESSYDVEPLKYYSDRIGQIVANCLTINPVNRPDINGVAQLCMEQLMSYTDRSCATIQSLEKRLRHREHQRELQFIRQHPQYNQRCFSCSSAKESLVSSSNGLADVSFDGLDGQPDTSRHDLNQSGNEVALFDRSIDFFCPLIQALSTKRRIIKPKKTLPVMLQLESLQPRRAVILDVNRLESFPNNLRIQLKVNYSTSYALSATRPASSICFSFVGAGSIIGVIEYLRGKWLR